MRERHGRADAYVAVLDASLNVLVKPHPIVTRAGERFLPSVSVDPETGVPVACFYDTYPDARETTAAYVCSASRDGGKHWSSPRAAGGRTLEPYAADDRVQLGDYNRVAAANGVVHAIWVESTRAQDQAGNGVDVYTAALDERSLGYAAR
jgi:hypothetical protein